MISSRQIREIAKKIEEHGNLEDKRILSVLVKLSEFTCSDEAEIEIPDGLFNEVLACLEIVRKGLEGPKS